MICSDCKLQAELKNFFSILLVNGYPDHVIEKAIARKLKTFTSLTSYTVKKCPVYLHLPWLGTPSVGLNTLTANRFFPKLLKNAKPSTVDIRLLRNYKVDFW